MEITKEEVKQLIQIEKPDTYWTHFLNTIANNKFYNGIASEKEVRLWKRNMWTMSLYTVFIFSFNKNNHLIDIRTKLNVFGKVFFTGIFLAILTFFSYRLSALYQNERFWLYSCIAIVFLVIYICFCKVVYESEKRIQRKRLFEILDIEDHNKDTIKEHSLFSFFLRIFTYPIGLGALYVSIFHFFPSEQYVYGISAIFIVVAYFITDIILIFRRK